MEKELLDGYVTRRKCRNRQEALRDMLHYVCDESQPELILPDDTRCRRLYEAFLARTTDDNPRVMKSSLQEIRLVASIAGMNTLKSRIAMLKAQKFLAEKRDFFFVIRRYA